MEQCEGAYSALPMQKLNVSLLQEGEALVRPRSLHQGHLETDARPSYSKFRLSPRFRSTAVNRTVASSPVHNGHVFHIGTGFPQQYRVQGATQNHTSLSSWVSASSHKTEGGRPCWRRHFRSETDGVVKGSGNDYALHFPVDAKYLNGHVAAIGGGYHSIRSGAVHGYPSPHDRNQATPVEAQGRYWPHVRYPGVGGFSEDLAAGPESSHRHVTRPFVASTLQSRGTPPPTAYIAQANALPQAIRSAVQTASMGTFSRENRVATKQTEKGLLRASDGTERLRIERGTAGLQRQAMQRHSLPAAASRSDDRATIHRDSLEAPTIQRLHSPQKQTLGPFPFSTSRDVYKKDIPWPRPLDDPFQKVRFQRQSDPGFRFSPADPNEVQHPWQGSSRDKQGVRHHSTLTSPPEQEDPPFPPSTSHSEANAAVDNCARGEKRVASGTIEQPSFKKAKGFDKLDLLCSATLDIGELHDNPTGCSCPKSKCVALYCDCFKAGRRCNAKSCSCAGCKNTIAESGVDGARTKAIRCILARNPRAFNTAGIGNPTLKLPPGETACNCVRSRCLKLYCSCFHNGKTCKPDVCSCVECQNTKADVEGHRKAAMQQAIEKRADAFNVKPKAKGLGCACKNNRCIRKYCECFRTGLSCSDKCTCRDCENQLEASNNASRCGVTATSGHVP
jgi:Tesmin/TSO1-like CXC domain, cysteine-rich domain